MNEQGIEKMLRAASDGLVGGSVHNDVEMVRVVLDRVGKRARRRRRVRTVAAFVLLGGVVGGVWFKGGETRYGVEGSKMVSVVAPAILPLEPKVSVLGKEIAAVEERIAMMESVERGLAAREKLARVEGMRKPVLTEHEVAEMAAAAVIEVAEVMARDQKRQAEAMMAFAEVAQRYPGTIAGEEAKERAEQIRRDLKL